MSPVVPEIPERYIPLDARRRVAALADVVDDDGMQDWPLEVADPDRVHEFVGLLQRADNDDDRFALMELVLYSLDEANHQVQLSLWPVIAAILEQHSSIFAQRIVYWSCAEDRETGEWRLTNDPDKQFSITPLMRDVLQRVATIIGVPG